MINLKSISKNSPKPPRVVIYGGAGVGKTTFASCADKPIFILTEDGLGDIPAECIPFDEAGERKVAESYQEVMDALSALGREEHDYKTVIIDSLDWLEPLVWKATCSRINASSIESPGYGRGYVETDTEWLEFYKMVTALREFKGMTVIMIAHDLITHVEDPLHPAYDTHGLKLHKRAKALASEYSDIIGFAAIETYVTTEKKLGGQKDDMRSMAITTGKHVLYLTPTPAYTAKSRVKGMPDVVDLDWEVFASHLPMNRKTNTPTTSSE